MAIAKVNKNMARPSEKKPGKTAIFGDELRSDFAALEVGVQTPLTAEHKNKGGKVTRLNEGHVRTFIRSVNSKGGSIDAKVQTVEGQEGVVWVTLRNPVKLP